LIPTLLAKNIFLVKALKLSCSRDLPAGEGLTIEGEKLLYLQLDEREENTKTTSDKNFHLAST